MLRAIGSLLVFCHVVAIFTLAQAGAAFAAQSALVYVLDSSNSMWAQINGEHKVVTVRNALATSFQRLAGRMDAGVVSFGHRQAGLCSDIQTVVPVGAINPAEFSATVSGLNPKGATPIAAALKQAVDAARDPASQRAMDVVLVFDGRDNCSGNPCAVAAELKQQNPGLRIHAIAFDETIRAEHENLACLASVTGGQFYRATNGTEFETAIAGIEAFALGGAPAEPVVVADATPQPPPNPAVLVAVTNPLIGTVEAPAPPLPDLPTLRGPAPEPETTGSLADGQVTGDAATETVAEPPASSPVAPSPQSLSGITISNAVPSGEIISRLQEQISGETQPATFGILRLSATLTPDSPPLRNGLVWRVFSSTPDEQGNFKVVAREDQGAPTFQLETGEYILHVAYGRANATREISLTAGTLDEVIVLNAGGLRLSSRLANDEPLQANKARHTVYSSEQDEFGQRKLIMPSAPEDLIIRLNAGTYYVVSQYGDANAVVRADVQVQAGKLTEATISHSAARITLKLVTNEGGEALAGTAWSVLDETGNIVAESVGAFPSYLLAAGNYTVLARNNGESFNRNFSVEPGQNSEVEVLMR